MTTHYVNDSATAEWLRECADLEHSDGETLYVTPSREDVFDVDLDDERQPLRRIA